MSVYFYNPGTFDLDTIRVMGVNIKTIGNPLGHFGTGMKYGIATFLRTGHKVILECNGEKYEFTARKKLIRGEEFDMVFMNEEQLPFTTELGKGWKVWQAFREFHSNCTDEMGRITNQPPLENPDICFTVSGPEIDSVFFDRSKIFLHSDPLAIHEGVEIHAGETNDIFYRGVKVYTMPKRSKFTYNLTGTIELTEDRSLKSAYDAQYRISCILAAVNDKSILSKLVKRNETFWDTELDWTNGLPSEVFLDLIDEVYDDAHVSATCRAIYRTRRKRETTSSKIDISEKENSVIQDAIKLLEKLNVKSLDPDTINFVESLGEGVYGQVREGEIFIARQCIDNGRDFLAITLYEEWIHLRLGHADLTRSMQQFLFDKILSLITHDEVLF